MTWRNPHTKEDSKAFDTKNPSTYCTAISSHWTNVKYLYSSSDSSSIHQYPDSLYSPAGVGSSSNVWEPPTLSSKAPD